MRADAVCGVRASTRRLVCAIFSLTLLHSPGKEIVRRHLSAHTMTARKSLPVTQDSLVLRTDFSNDSAWHLVCADVQAPVGDFRAFVECVSDPEFAGVTPAELASLQPERSEHSFVFIVDGITLSSPEHPIVVVDLIGEPGRWFRVVPREAWAVQNNLSLANMDFVDFADSVDPDGVFRGF